MELGVYESLLTAKLFEAIAAADHVRAEYRVVDEAEQPLAITRHLVPIIERSMRVARTADERAELTKRILSVLPDIEVDRETLHPWSPGKIARLEELADAQALTAGRLPRPATPFSDAALMTNSPHEPTLAAELRAEMASADHVDGYVNSNWPRLGGSKWPRPGKAGVAV
ncbi:hypothetical protein CQY20_25965, partial [Mycolicibacterium agri]